MPKIRLAPEVGDNLSLTPPEPEDAPDTSVWSEDGAAGAETTVVPPPTVAGPELLRYPVGSADAGLELAWSADTEVVESGPQSWGTAWSIAAVIVACFAVAAFAIGVVGWTISREDADRAPAWTAPSPSTMPAAVISTAPAPTSTVTVQAAAPTSDPDVVAPPTTVTVMAAPPPPVTVQAQPRIDPGPSEADLDEQYLNDLTGAGLKITSVREVIAGAHSVCAYLGAGHSEADAVRTAMHGNTTLTEGNALTLVDSAVRVYCPQEE
jgi:hypothetical protein